MKLQSLKSKTAIEVTDDDLLVIEDKEDTKTITVGQFKVLMNTFSEVRVKHIFNECIDRMCAAFEQAKFTFPEKRNYLVNAWIGSTSGNVQITLKDITANKWLTREELVQLVMDENGQMQSDFAVRLFAGDAYHDAEGYQLLNFVDYHDRSVNEWLYDSNAGFIKVSFGEDFENNEIAAIRHGDIEVTIKNRVVSVEEDGTETIEPEPEPEPIKKEYEFNFITSKDSFANAVEFRSIIPPGTPDWMGGDE